MFYASEETVFKDNPDAWLYKREPEFYQSEEFLMFYHKVLPCPHVMPHNWQECPWTHRGERAARRDLRKCQYSSQLCSKIQRGLECPNGSRCDKAHNIFESWLHPEQFRTQRCGAGVTCLRKVCFFAHSQAELRKPAKIVWPKSVTATAAAAGQTEQGSATPEQTEEGNNAGSTAAGDAAGSSGSNSSPVAGTAGMMRNTGSSARSLAQQQQQDDVDDCAACSACAACPAAPIPLAVGSAAAAGGGKDTLVLALGQLTMTPAIATESSATPMAAAAAAAYSGGSDSACTAAGGCSKAGKITSTDPIMMNDQSQSGKISLGSMARQHRHAAASVAARDAGTQQHPRLNLQQAMQLHQQQQAQLQQRQQLQNQQQQQLQLQQQQQQRQLQQQQMLQIQAQLHILQQQQQLMSPSAFAPSTGTSLDQAPGPMGSSPHMPMSPAAAAAAPVSLLPLTGFGSLGSESLSGLQGLPLQHLSPSPSLDQQHELLLLLQQYEQQQQRVAQHQLNQAAAGAVFGSGLMSPMTTLPTLGLHPSLATANALPSAAAAAAAAAFSPAAAAAFSHNSMELPTLSSNSFGALTGLSQLSGLSSGDAAAFMQQQQPPSRHIPRGW